MAVATTTDRLDHMVNQNFSFKSHREIEFETLVFGLDVPSESNDECDVRSEDSRCHSKSFFAL